MKCVRQFLVPDPLRHTSDGGQLVGSARLESELQKGQQQNKRPSTSEKACKKHRQTWGQIFKKS